MRLIHKTTFLKLLSLLLLACLNACALSPEAKPKKVQTHEELFMKLKEGFYSGKLMESDFFSKELGYPLKTPLRFFPNEVKDLERTKVLNFEGEVFRLSALYVTSVTTNGRKIVYTRYENGDPNICLKESDFLRIWESKNLTIGQDPAYHRRYVPGIIPVRITFWDAEFKMKNMRMRASFEVYEPSKCMGQASMSVSDI